MADADPPAELAEALDRARQIRQECYESIGGRWFHDIGRLLPGEGNKSQETFKRAALEAFAPANK